MKLISTGYHFDSHGQKFVRVFSNLTTVKVQVKIQKGKTMHIDAISVDFPYTITENWVEIVFDYQDITSIPRINYPGVVESYVDRRLTEIWFES